MMNDFFSYPSFSFLSYSFFPSSFIFLSPFPFIRIRRNSIFNSYHKYILIYMGLLSKIIYFLDVSFREQINVISFSWAIQFPFQMSDDCMLVFIYLILFLFLFFLFFLFVLIFFRLHFYFRFCFCFCFCFFVFFFFSFSHAFFHFSFFIFQFGPSFFISHYMFKTFVIRFPSHPR